MAQNSTASSVTFTLHLAFQNKSKAQSHLCDRNKNEYLHGNFLQDANLIRENPCDTWLVFDVDMVYLNKSNIWITGGYLEPSVRKGIKKSMRILLQMMHFDQTICNLCEKKYTPLAINPKYICILACVAEEDRASWIVLNMDATLQQSWWWMKRLTLALGSINPSPGGTQPEKISAAFGSF